MMKEQIPDIACSLILDASYRGGDVVIMPAKKVPIKQKDLIINYIWILAVVKCCSDKVPSGFFLADVFCSQCTTNMFQTLCFAFTCLYQRERK